MPFSIKKFAQLHRNQSIPGSSEEQKHQPQQPPPTSSSSGQTIKSKSGHTLSHKQSIDNNDSTVGTKTSQSNKKGSKKSKSNNKQSAAVNDKLDICSPTPAIRNNNIQSQQLLLSSPETTLPVQHQTAQPPAPLPRTVPPSFIICNQTSMINVPLYSQTSAGTGAISPLYNPPHHPSLGSLPNSRSFDIASGTITNDLYRSTNQSSKISFFD